MPIDWGTVGVSAAIAAGAWAATNFVGKPIIGIRAARLAAVEAVELHTYIAVPHTLEAEDRVRAAKTKLRTAAGTLRSYGRTSNLLVGLYCRATRCDLEKAAVALLGLAVMAGDPRYGDSTRSNNLNLFYWAIGSDRHLTSSQRAEVKTLWENRQQEAELE